MKKGLEVVNARFDGVLMGKQEPTITFLTQKGSPKSVKLANRQSYLQIPDCMHD